MMRDYLTEHGTDADVSECLGEIFDSIGESDAAEGEKAYFKAAAALGIDRPVTRKRHRAVSWFAGIAAALAVLIAGGATALLVDGSRDVEWNEIKVPAGQTRELVLADGTVLQLNAGSRVTYPASFRRCRTREIFAEGEIYAEVAKDPKHPFFINSGDVGVKVLGTKFNFKAYGDSRCVELLLFEGAVEFGIPLETAVAAVTINPARSVGLDHRIGSIEDGKCAAESLHRYVHMGADLKIGRNRRDFIMLDKDDIVVDSYDTAGCQEAGMDETVDYHHSFRDAHGTLTEEQVKKETARCLGCGASWVDPNKCIGCGICTTKCAFDAIHLKRDHPECSTMVRAEDKLKGIASMAVKRLGETIRGKKE